MIDWPKTLPQEFLYAGFSEQMGESRLRSQTDAGPGKMRPRFSRAIDTLRCSMSMTLTQKLAFRTFIRTTLGQGSMPFKMPVPQQPGQTMIVTIGENMPTFTPQRPGKGNRGSAPIWKVDFTLNVMP